MNVQDLPVPIGVERSFSLYVTYNDYCCWYDMAAPFKNSYENRSSISSAIHYENYLF